VGRSIHRQVQAVWAALKAKHPEIQLVTSAGPFPSGAWFDFLWTQLRAVEGDIVDEHYYSRRPGSWRNATRYDQYESSGPKIFAGEYAAHTPAAGRDGRRNNWQAGLAEAAFMTGLDGTRTSVRMASYAPAAGALEPGSGRRSDLVRQSAIFARGLLRPEAVGTNVGTRCCRWRSNGAAAAAQNGLYASAALDERAHEIIVKVVTPGTTPGRADTRSMAWPSVAPAARIVLSSNDLQAENSLDSRCAWACRNAPRREHARTCASMSPAQSVTVVARARGR